MIEISLYLGGEKLNRTPIHLTAVLFAAASLLIGTGLLSAQEASPSVPEMPAEGSAPEAASPDPESFFNFDTVASDGAVAPSGGASFFVVLRMVLVLAMTAAAVYGVVYFLRRAGQPGKDQRNPHLKILTSAHLGSNRYVYVVSVGTKAWLVGAGEGGVTPIAELTDQEAVDAMLLDDSRRSAEAAPSRFSGFRALLGRLGGGASVKGSGPISAGSLRARRERLKGL